MLDFTSQAKPADAQLNQDFSRPLRRAAETADGRFNENRALGLAYYRGEEFLQNGAARANLGDLACFGGLGFGRSGTPIDIAAILIAARAFKNFTAVVTDAFYSFNGQTPSEVEAFRDRFEPWLKKCIGVFCPQAEVLRSSAVFHTSDYPAAVQEYRQLIEKHKLQDELLETVPAGLRNGPNAIEYSLNEIALCSYLQRLLGVKAKLGPSRERLYDGIMAKLGIPLQFTYVIDAYPIGMKDPVPVVHYSPADRGGKGSNGQRIYFEDKLSCVQSKILQAPPETTHYLLRLGSGAVAALNGQPPAVPTLEEVGRRLSFWRKAANHLICDYVYGPVTADIRSAVVNF